ncbi:uncharacterized protein A4U43_C03F26340 [Asparagus officinalis]|uniref:Serine aminopeptidase S33 domain-containing protein n=1 Tax=Asparagus officinalis TaxID=4686 RepID=A0A5P1FD70_ASPOF|nr:uncharacterized protein A4U43_C03F26340 [Asparagus officinalis]
MEAKQQITEGSEISGLSLFSMDADGEKLNSLQHEVPAISQEKITIKNNSGENLVGTLHDVGSNNLVILCHGFRSSKESKTILSITDVLTNEGISVFRFDFSGNGESEGSFQYGNFWREVDDLRAVILYLTGQKRKVDAIVGHSKGGNVVLLYASKYQDISTVINISGRFDLKGGIEGRLGKNFMEKIRKDGFIGVTDKKGEFMYQVTKESLEDRLRTDMRAACLSIEQSCRVLTVHGSEDETVPFEDALEFSKLIINHKLHIVQGADHRYMSHQLELAKTLLEFIRSN